MKFSTAGTSIIESMIVMLIVITGVIGMYTIFTNSMKVSESASNRVQAIAMAREGIEAVTNIRDTNWLLYSANTEDCWNTFNYDGSCITTNIDIGSGSYILYQNEDSKRWFLSWVTVSGNYSNTDYREAFKVGLQEIGSGTFYTQSWATRELKPLFTREIKIEYPSDAWTPPQKMKVESIVRWTDSARNAWNYEVKLETILTNWKK